MSGRAWLALVIVVGLVTGSVLFIWLTGRSNAGGSEETTLPNRTDMPVAIAAARDGTVWFTLESSDVIGRLRNGQIERIPKGAQSIEPLGLAVDVEGRAWYTEAPKQSISRASPDGAIATFGLSTPVARLGRLTVGPDNTVWFAVPTRMSVNRLRHGRFTHYRLRRLTAQLAADDAPSGVPIARDGAVWSTLP